MFSMNLKRKVAVLLTGIMVFGSTFTVFAADPANPSTKEGTGTFEGTVDREIMDVVLPTVPDAYNPFNFQVDPERLIKETEGMRYSGFSFPTTGDTGVYFQVSSNEYANETNEFTATNKGAVSANLIVEVEAKSSPAYTIELVDDKDEATPAAEAVEADPKLYIGLKVADKDPVAVTSANKATASVVMVDSKENYTVSWNGTKEKYEFIKKANASGWDEKSFSIEGSTNYVKNAAGATAPSIVVTWKYETMAEKAARESAAGVEAAATTAANTFKTNYPVALKAVNEVVAGDLANITAAQAAFEALTDAAKAKLAANDPAITAETLAALKAKCDELQITNEAAGVIFVEGAYWLGKTTSAGFDTSVSPTEVTLKCGDNEAIDVTSAATVVNDGGYWVSVTWDAAEALGLQDGTTYVMTAKIGTVIYTGTVNF